MDERELPAWKPLAQWTLPPPPPSKINTKYQVSPYSIPPHSAASKGAMTAEQCSTYKALQMYLPSLRCFLVPGPNNILSTSHSVLALPCQPHITVMAIAFLPPLPHTPQQWHGKHPPPPAPFSDWLYFWHVSVYFTCAEVTNPTSSTSPVQMSIATI